ncbi:MAG: nucleotidyltransferase domain-containing protein [Spirochaetales bacterium]|nr:nucleotidyltransferase domain-containing protein [Spirochaetales bacterium]
MKDISEIKTYLARKKPQLEKYGITEIGIFGSYGRGTAAADSDIDILIDIRRPSLIGLLELLEIENQLSEDLQAKVDLVLKSDLKPAIGSHILREVQYI